MKLSTMGLLLLATSGLVVTSCESENDPRATTFPDFQDRDGNGINDYVEVGSHVVSTDDPRQHDYVDADGNGSCDLADPPDPAWHGPGYVDANGNGVCDYWDRDFDGHQVGRRDIVHGSDFGDVMPRASHH